MQGHQIHLGAETRSGYPILHPINLWLVKHAGDLYTKFSVGSDGMTPYRRLKGKECSEEHVEFGELVFYKKRKGQVGKYAPQFEFGVRAGRRWGIAEHVILDKDRVVYARSIHRKPEAER